MGFVPCPFVAEVRMIYTDQLNQVAMNTYHFIGSGGWTATLLTNLATSMATWENSAAFPAKALRQNSVQLTQISVRDLSAQSNPEVIVPQSIFGTDADPPVPNNVTIAIKHATNVAGRAFRGRTYWIGLTTAQLDSAAANQAVTTAAQTALLNIMNQFLTGTGLALPNAAAPVVLSRYHGKDGNGRPIPRAQGIATPVVNYGLVDRFLDSQRRRLVGHNRHRR